MKRAVAIVLIVAGAVLLMGSAMAFTLNERTATTEPDGRFSRVVLENENGDVTVRTGDRAQVRRTERWNFDSPEYSEEVEDGTLRIRTDCTSVLVFNNCGVELALVVPGGVDIATKSTNGDTTVTGLDGGSLAIATTNGDVDVTETDGERVTVTSTNGDLTFDDVAAEELRAATTNGDIDVDLRDAPDAITLNSTNGDIDAAVPSGTYDIRTATTNGDVSVADDLGHREGAERSVVVATTNGDIDLVAS